MGVGETGVGEMGVNPVNNDTITAAKFNLVRIL